ESRVGGDPRGRRSRDRNRARGIEEGAAKGCARRIRHKGPRRQNVDSRPIPTILQRVPMAETSGWRIAGDWFDNCSCAVPCPCTFAQPPDNGFCESVLFWHIRRGHYGDISLDGLSFVRVGRWEGDLWAGKVKGSAGIFIDERADARQAEVLPRI